MTTKDAMLRAAAQGTSDYILIRIKRPEDYEDVHPELVVEDFLSTPRNPVWEMEIVGPAAPQPAQPVAWAIRDATGKLLMSEARGLLAFFDTPPFPLYEAAALPAGDAAAPFWCHRASHGESRCTQECVACRAESADAPSFDDWIEGQMGRGLSRLEVDQMREAWDAARAAPPGVPGTYKEQQE